MLRLLIALSGKYAMRDLVQKLPSGNPQHDHGTSDDTIAAVLATLNEVIKKHPEFSRHEKFAYTNQFAVCKSLCLSPFLGLSWRQAGLKD